MFFSLGDLELDEGFTHTFHAKSKNFLVLEQRMTILAAVVYCLMESLRGIVVVVVVVEIVEDEYCC